MDKDKIRVVLEWEEAKNLKALRGLLALTGYYIRFEQGYGKLAKPLRELLKKRCLSGRSKLGQLWKHLNRPSLLCQF